MTVKNYDKLLDVGQRVFVWEWGTGFATGEDIDRGVGTIQAVREEYVDSFRNELCYVYTILLDKGETVEGCCDDYHNRMFYFTTKEKYNQHIDFEITDIDRRIKELLNKKSILEKSHIE